MSEFSEFLSEAQELIETFSRLLFEIEDRHRDNLELDPDQINASFRSIHTLKGLAGLAGSDQLKQLTHEIETTLDAVRLGKVKLTGKLLNLLVDATNAFERLLRNESVNSDALLAKIRGVIAAPDETDEVDLSWLDDSIRGVLTEFEEHRLRENIRMGRRIHRVHVEFDLMTFGDGIDVVKTKLKQHGEVITFLPSTDNSDFERMGFAILVGSTASEKDIAAAVAEEGGIVDVLGATAEPSPPPAPPSDPPEAYAREASDEGGSQTVRVDLRRLDLLMNLVGELALVQANLTAYGDRVRGSQTTAQNRELQGQLRTMTRRLGQLQEGILEVRMVPIQSTFERVKRLVHRTSHSQDKEVRLIVSGTETELDKQIGEKLSKPLIHMVNNAISHGIERPSEREALGKPRIGRVELTAYQKGNRVVIELTDDGRGIDWREIRDKALAKGFITREEAADIDPTRAINLIFMPGFSSKDSADDIAGRGFGMDVVKTEIAKLSGMIDVATEPGKGSRFRVTLPSTMAIIQALIIQSASQTFCIQLNSVLESLMVHRRDIQTIEGHEVVSVRGRTLPLLHLSRVFELDDDGTPRHAYDRLYVVVVGLAEHRVGLVVDELLGQRDVVIKPIGSALMQIPGIAGATELGDNRTVLLLDVATLVSEAVGGIESAVAGVAAAGREGIRVSTRLD